VRFCNINIEGRTLCILLVECCELTWISHSTFLPFLKHNVQTSCSDHPARSSIVPNINVPVHITPKDITAVYEKRCMSLGDCTSGCFLPPPHPILFKHTDLNIAFRATNTSQQQLSEKQNNINPNGIYKLKCNTCNKSYVGQILQNRHEYGTIENTLQLLKTCRKSTV